MKAPAAAMPRLGLGTAPGPSARPVDLAPALAAGLEAGCRLFDTAEAYGSEEVLGQLVASAGVARDELYLVSKLWQTNHEPERVAEACRGSLARLGVGRLDLYLVHSPEAWRHRGPLRVEPGWEVSEIAAHAVPRSESGEVERFDVPIEETWQAMLELRRGGLTRDVGVANFGRAELEALRAAGLEAPAALQVEIHPLNPREELLRYCRARGIRVMAHSPFAGGRVLGHPEILGLARDLGWSPARLVLGWHLARGVVPVPGSHRPAHARENLQALASPLPPEAAAALDALAPARSSASGGA